MIEDFVLFKICPLELISRETYFVTGVSEVAPRLVKVGTIGMMDAFQRFAADRSELNFWSPDIFRTMVIIKEIPNFEAHILKCKTRRKKIWI